MTLYSNEEGEQGGATPSIALLKRGTENFMVLVRDARTTYEGRLYAQHEMALKYQQDFIDPVQEGVSSTLIAAMAPLELHFNTYFQNNYNLTEYNYNTTMIHPRILVVGSGAYGGSVAAVLAEYFAFKWDNPSLPWSSMLSIDTILFGASRVGGEDFVTSYNTKVNGRNIISKYSVANAMPCDIQMLCNQDQIKTGTQGNLEGHSKLGGTVVIDTESDPAFSKVKGWSKTKSRLDLAGHQYCVPKCWLTKTFCPQDKQDMCDNDTCPGLFDGN
eukprot:CAMPEP_0113852336 /NCGR_PEP_ID=MMETSP0372-20130328/5415_1 /TAXON_ID=340204 /ORGANISM="Lankesteria abbotti" /LENGTH=272 /DNA_ID=CAMNT_0000823797 /DNA_START=38 /DNA_END=856 /DNA_ORIENTATION=- /assembly_acc=CAM_ASM_000359